MNTRSIACLLLAATALLPLTACHRKASQTQAAADATPAANVVVSGARLVLPAVPGNPGALYLTIANPAEAPIRLTGISVAGAATTELHETKGGTMAPLAGLEIAPGAAASLAPGNRHAMVVGLSPVPKPGSQVAINLLFAGGASFSTTASVETIGHEAAMDSMPAMTGHNMEHMH